MRRPSHATDALGAMHVLILCDLFPPVNGTGARRPYYLARQLVERGHKVSVITTERQESHPWQADRSGMRVHHVPPTHLQRDMPAAQRLLARLDHFAMGKWWHGPVRVIADLLLPLEHRTRWDLDVPGLREAIGTPDLIVATGPGWSTLEWGSRLARQWNVPLDLDYRDAWNLIDQRLYNRLLHDLGRGPVGALRRCKHRKVEQRIGRSALLVTAATDAVLANARSMTGVQRGATITGGFDPGHPRKASERNARFTVVHTGRLYPEQPWDVVLEALGTPFRGASEAGAPIVLKLLGAVSGDAALMQRMENAARAGLVELLPPTGRDEALDQQQQADLLLHLAFARGNGFLPVKFLEYLNAGPPILVVAPDPENTGPIVERTGTGRVARTAEEVHEVLQEHLRAFEKGAPITCSPKTAELVEYSYPYQMDRWVDLLEAAVNETRSGRTKA